MPNSNDTKDCIYKAYVELKTISNESQSRLNVITVRCETLMDKMQDSKYSLQTIFEKIYEIKCIAERGEK